ncbi:uncharacterized protein LOC113509726 isoform X1 [Galleria mellonella]|uniref:Uncharacterized protein LOC113509726 isoform X1 n=1 Tax=Galleria mellonella TaxID=7137 RepID=A0A6J1W7Y4_GALME|nr:uncharacterized protein LOC113509726 isoform X1 [Galleria mellonella]
MDNNNKQDDALFYTSSSKNVKTNSATQAAAENKNLGDFLDADVTLGSQSKQSEINISSIKSRPPSLKRTTSSSTKGGNNNEEKQCLQCKDSPESCCHLKLDSILKLKESTRKLLCLLEEIQSKTDLKSIIPNDTPNLSNILKSIPPTNSDENDDCSVYKRLTRRCHCLNQLEYNDFIIHFNEDTKYFTSNMGEIIKNMRILKKFLYMNGCYTKKALMFLNEGLQECTHTEKVEITQGCAYADMCNVFDDHSIVIICISWPCKYSIYGDTMTQALTASFLYKLAYLEEGRRYLNFSSKITNDIKKVLKKKASKLGYDTIETLNATLNLLHPPLPEHINVTYYCKPVDQALGNKTVNALVQYRQYMTLHEVFINLDLLQNLSKNDNGKEQLTVFLPVILNLFKNMLMEYDNSEMNITVMNILNNIVFHNFVKEKKPELPADMVITDTTTEPIKMKNEFNQITQKRNTRKSNKSKLGLGLSPNRHRQSSKRKDIRSSVIIVPIEK